MYEIRTAPGWHQEPHDPVIESGDEISKYVRARAGEAVVIPGNGWQVPQYLVLIDEDGDETVEDCESTFCCAHCGTLYPLDAKHGAGWDEYQDPDSAEPHLVDWVCEECWIASLEVEEEEEEEEEEEAED